MKTALKKLTYEDLVLLLHDKHFYPKQRMTSGKITGLEVYCSPILRDDKKKVLEQALEGTGAKVTWFGNDHDYLLIELPKSKSKD